MYSSARESRVLSRIFGLPAEDMAEHAVRERLGHGLLELLEADCFGCYVLVHSVGHPVVGPGQWYAKTAVPAQAGACTRRQGAPAVPAKPARGWPAE